MQGSLEKSVEGGRQQARPAAGRSGRWSDPIRFALGLVVTALAFLGWSLIALVFKPAIAPARRVRFGQRAISRSFSLLFRQLERLDVVTLDVSALDRLPDDAPLILVPNHPSLLDAPAIISRLPRVCCIMKHELLNNAFTGNGARLAGYVDNGSLTGMVRRSIAALEGGSHLLVFPEGTRSDAEPVGGFTRAYALIARKSGTPMQTLLIDMNSPYGTKCWPLARRPPILPIHLRIRLGRCFEAADDIDSLVVEMQNYFESELGRRADR